MPQAWSLTGRTEGIRRVRCGDPGVVQAAVGETRMAREVRWAAAHAGRAAGNVVDALVAGRTGRVAAAIGHGHRLADLARRVDGPLAPAAVAWAHAQAARRSGSSRATRYRACAELGVTDRRRPEVIHGRVPT